jgi:hypothetical protein
MDMPILLNLQRIIDRNTFDNFIVVIIHSLVFGGMSKVNITNKVVCFGFDGVIFFQGLTLKNIPQKYNQCICNYVQLIVICN